MLYNPTAELLRLPIIEVFAAFMGNIVTVIITTPENERQQSINRVSTECQQSANNFGCCILYNTRAVLRHLPIINILAAVMSKRDRDMVTSPV